MLYNQRIDDELIKNIGVPCSVSVLEQLSVGNTFVMFSENTFTCGIYLGIARRDMDIMVKNICNDNHTFVEDLDFDTMFENVNHFYVYSYLKLFTLEMPTDIIYASNMAINVMKTMFKDNYIHITKENVIRSTSRMVYKIDDDSFNTDIRVTLLKEKMLDKELYSDYLSLSDAILELQDRIKKELKNNPTKVDNIWYAAFENRKPVDCKTKGLVFKEKRLSTGEYWFKPYFIVHNLFNKNKVSVYTLANSPYVGTMCPLVFEKEDAEMIDCFKDTVFYWTSNKIDFSMYVNKPKKKQFPDCYFDSMFYIENIENLGKNFE